MLSLLTQVKDVFVWREAVPEYLAPGVYVEEVTFRGKSIEEISTSTSAFVGAVKTPPHPESEWKYVQLRRYLLFLEHSIDRGTQWTVFEPDDERLRRKLSDAIAEFLELQWNRGFLVGRTRNEAYFVRRVLPGRDDNDLEKGHLVIEIGVAPERPGYFEVFRMRRATAGAFPPAGALPELSFAVTTNEGTVIGVFTRATGLRDPDVGEDEKGSTATIVLKEGCTDFSALRAWVQARRTGNEKDLTVRERGRRGWKLARGQILKWKGPNLNAKGSEVAIEELEIAHEGVTIEDEDDDDDYKD